jgi:arsenate reductase (glutaredoxin)
MKLPKVKVWIKFCENNKICYYLVMITVYGITNCPTVQKARAWLDAQNIKYDFHDYKKIGIDITHLQKWCEKLGWEQVLNRQGMMWRKSPESEQQKVVDTQTAIQFMLKVPTAIKRPIIEYPQGILRGFDEDVYRATLL